MRLLRLCPVLLLAACHQPDRSGPEHLAKAQALFARQALTPARAEAEAALRADPRNGNAHLLAGRIEAARGDERAAFIEYRRAEMLDSTDHRARTAVIELLLDAGETDAALAHINASLADDPHNGDALALRALVEQRRGDASKARRDAEAVLIGAPQHSLAHAVLAALAAGQGATDAARADLARARAADPENRWLLQVSAGLSAQQNALVDTVATLRRLVDAHPELPRARMELAEVEAAFSGSAVAEATLRAAVADAPRSYPLRLALSTFLRKRGRSGEADDVLRQAALAFPDDSAADIDLAAALSRDGRSDAAHGVLQAAVNRLKLAPSAAPARLALVRLTIGDGDLRTARAMLDEMIRAKPDDDTALFLRAEILRPDETDRGIADLLAVSARRPDDPRPFDLLAKAYLRRGRTDEALAAARRAADLRPDDLAAAIHYADIAVAARMPEDGRRLIASLIARHPADLPARAALVRFAIGQQDWPAAQAALDGLKALPDSADLVLDLAAALKRAEGKPGEAADLLGAQLGTAAAARRIALAQAYAGAAVAAGRGTEALARLQTLRSDVPQAQAGAFDLVVASVQAALHQTVEAAASDDAAIRTAPKDAGGYLHKAADLAGARQSGSAMAVLDAGLAAGAPPVPLLLSKASLLLGDGATDRAIEAYQAVLAKAPGDITAANNLTSLLADRRPVDSGLLATARDALRRYAASTEPHLLDSLAWADYRLGDLDEARQLLDRADAETSPIPELRYHYGAVLIASGEKARGQALIRSVIDKNFAGKGEAESLLTD